VSWNAPRRLALLLVAVPAACARPVPVPPGTTAYALEGGRWFDGEGFASRTMYVLGDVLHERSPERIDSTIDLSGRWIVPPYGDAHTHNLDGGFRLEEMREAYRAEGTFYVQVLTNTTRGAAAVRDSFARRGTLDVRYANGGFTSTLGHPFLAYEPRAIGIFSQAALEARAAALCASRRQLGNAYWFVDDASDLERVWSEWLRGGPDVLKIFLLHSERFRPDTSCALLHPEGPEAVAEQRGLDPALVPAIVERAHAAGIPVWAHVESAHDVAVAVRAGVDGLAHIPGYQLRPRDPTAPYEIDADVAALAGQRGVAVTPTLIVGDTFAGPDSTGARRQLRRRTLERLREAGARIVVGSDAYGRTAGPEVEALRALGLWDNLALLRMWAVTTPQVIFPDRRIGRLADGYEASLLALECDPLTAWDCTARISLTIKDGLLLAIEPRDRSSSGRP